MKQLYSDFLRLRVPLCCKLSFYLILITGLSLKAQESDVPDSLKIPFSIHQEQTEYYDSLGVLPDSVYDRMNGFKPVPQFKTAVMSECSLVKMVYGFWPYWGGSSYQNFKWNLLSDLVYHSYEIDPYTGKASSVHDWGTSSAVNEALDKGVRVSLNATLFSKHATFLTNPAAVDNFISNIIQTVKARKGKGVCIDFETMASSNKTLFANFMIQLSGRFHDSIPGSVVGLCIPSVEWSNIFDVVAMRNHVDYFILMGYDYYYAGSAQAGPVGPLYSMSSAFNYNLNKSIVTWINKGIPKEQLILGLPYYGREWGTASNTVPSATKGGSANSQSRTLKYIHDNSTGFYSGTNKFWENNSFTPYYVYSNANGYRQCFIDDTISLGKRLDMINQRDLAGMGIWALGYDHGYEYYWNKIRDKLSTCQVVARTDSIFDAGGPAFNYYNNEDYTFTIRPTDVSGVTLDFQTFSVEDGNDSIYIYNGKKPSYLIGAYSGLNSPGVIKSNGDALILRVKTNGSTTAPGWKATWTSITTTSLDDFEAGVGHFEKAPVYNGVFTFPFTEPQQTVFTSRNGLGSLEVKLLDLGMFEKDSRGMSSMKCNGLDWNVVLLSGEGLQSRNTSVKAKGTLSFWLKTSDVDTGTLVKIRVNDLDGIEESEAIKINSDGEWHYYIWDLSRIQGNSLTGNGKIDGDSIYLNSIVLSSPALTHSRSENSMKGWFTSMYHRKHVEKWTLFIDDVMHDLDVNIPVVLKSATSFAKNPDNLSDNNQILVYPNPNNGRFTIDLGDKEINHFTVEVLNSSGIKIFSQKFSGNSHSVDLTQLPKGLYLLNISSEGFARSIKMIIE